MKSKILIWKDRSKVLHSVASLARIAVEKKQNVRAFHCCIDSIFDWRYRHLKNVINYVALQLFLLSAAFAFNKWACLHFARLNHSIQVNSDGQVQGKIAHDARCVNYVFMQQWFFTCTINEGDSNNNKIHFNAMIKIAFWLRICFLFIRYLICWLGIDGNYSPNVELAKNVFDREFNRLPWNICF